MTGLYSRQNDREILHRLFCQFDAIDDEEDALGIAGREKAPNQRRAEKRLARAGRHFQKELAAAVASNCFAISSIASI